MKLLQQFLPGDCDIYEVGDSHNGSLCCHEEAEEEMVSKVEKNPIGYLGFMGDAAETVFINHPYYDPESLKKDGNSNVIKTDIQCEVVAKRYSPIADKLLFWLMGNHEYRVLKTHNMVDMILKDKNIDRREIGCDFAVKFTILDKKGKPKLKLYAHHGSGLSNNNAGTERQKRTNSLVALQRKLSPMAGDCICQSIGHTHKLLVAEPLSRLYLVDEGGKIKQKYIKTINNDGYIDPENRWYCNTGSFFKSQMIGFDSYAERNMYPPTELGYIVIHIRDYKVESIEKVIV